MPRIAAVQLDRDLMLKLYSLDAGKSVSVRLNRITAQHLADALLEYAGAMGKSNRVDTAGRRVMFGAPDLTDVPKAATPTRRRTLRL